MRKSILVFISLGLLLTPACQDNANVEKEKEAILNVLLEEGRLFSEFDMNGITELHITDATATRYDGGSKVYSGWDDIESLYESYIERNKEFQSDNDRNEKENVIIKVNGNNAWVICDNIWKWDENEESFSAMNKQIAFLEKVDGEWKIAFNSFVQDNTEQERNKQIAVIYHELDPKDIDEILAVDFIGHWNGNDWNREDHRRAWSNNEAKDKIVFMIAENDMVAVKFVRMGENEGKSLSVDVMQFMQIKDGKIVEIWELFNQSQLESQGE
jgi:hypothetical protein